VGLFDLKDGIKKAVDYRSSRHRSRQSSVGGLGGMEKQLLWRVGSGRRAFGDPRGDGSLANPLVECEIAITCAAPVECLDVGAGEMTQSGHVETAASLSNNWMLWRKHGAVFFVGLS